MATGLKRLLAVSWAMPPMLFPRSIQVSRVLSALKNFGWEITVICSDPYESGNIDLSLAGIYTDCYEIIQVPIGNSKIPTDALVSNWLKPALKTVKTQLASCKYSAFITFAQPWVDHIIGLEARSAHHIPWIVHFSDPWVDSTYYAGFGKKQLDRWRKMEHKVVQRADLIIFTNTQAVDLVMNKYPYEWNKKTRVIPHAFDENMFSALKPQTAKGGPLKMIYTGDLYKGRSAEKLLRALALLSRTRLLAEEIEVKLIGRITPEEKQMSQSLGLTGIVEFLDQLPYIQSLQKCALCDVLLLIDAPTSMPSPFLPSKLVDYLAFRKPIFALTPNNGASADLLHRLGFSTVPPDEAAAIAISLNDLLDSWHSGLLTIPVQYDQVVSQYSAMNVGAKFNEVLDEAISNHLERPGWQIWR